MSVHQAIPIPRARAPKATPSGSSPEVPRPTARGRGAITNRSGRFEREARERFGDGWDNRETEPQTKLRTIVTTEHPKHVLTRNSSPDLPFDRSVNPYRGCEHGCIYCYARPSHAFAGLSPGLDFETRLFAKPSAPAVLEKELARPGYKPAPIAFGTNTDPYQPIEKDLRITRDLLKLLARWNHPLTIVTKSALVLRDLDILAPLAEKRLVQVAVSVTTLDHHLARRMEPRATTPWKRLDAIRELAAAGVPTSVFFAPVIPALNDHEMEAVLEAAKDAGACNASYILLRLPLELTELFGEWLEAHYPNRAGRVLSHIRDLRHGKTNDARFFHRMRGSGPYADLISRRFKLAARRLGLDKAPPGLRTNLFRPPLDDGRQMALFEGS